MQIWQQLFHLFIVFFLLLWVCLFIVPVNFFKEVVKISFEPLTCIIGCVSCYVKPSLSIHVHILLLISHIKIDFKNLVGLNQVNGPLSISLDGGRNFWLLSNLA